MPNMILKQNVFQRLRAMKTQIVNVEDRFHALGDLGVDPRVVDEDAGIDKIGLALDLAAAQARQHAIGLHQANARLGQPDAIAIPERKLSADEIGIVEDRIESGGLRVSGIRVPLSKKEGAFETQIVMIDRGFDGSHIRLYTHAASGDRVTIVATKSVKIRMRQIQPAEVSIAADSDIANFDRMWPRVSNQRRPHEETIAIVFDTRAVVVVMQAALNRVAFANEVLPK